MCSEFSKELSYYWGLTAAPPWFHWVSSVEYYQIATHETLNAAPLPTICSLLESSITCQVATHGSCLVHFLEAVVSFQVVERFNIYHIVALPHTAHPCVCSLQVLQVFEYYEYCKYLSITSIILLHTWRPVQQQHRGFLIAISDVCASLCVLILQPAPNICLRRV